MKKPTRIVSLVLCFVMLCGLLPIQSIAAHEKQDYTLTPTTSIGGGIDPTSKFELTVPKGIFLADIKAHIFIDGEPQPTVSSIDNEKFLITPVRPFKSSTLYTVRLKMPNANEISWVFQTMVDFRIVSTLPADESTDVPVNSGIEINFNYENFEDIAKYFSIEPKVEGTFENHGKTAVFVPKALQYKTLYTVTVKKGVKLNGSSYKTANDVVFRFETKAKEHIEAPEPSIEVRYRESQLELTPRENPTLSLIVRQYGDNKLKMEDAKTTVYAFPSAEAYAKAMESNRYSWSWACYYNEDNYIETNKLPQVLSFSTDLSKSKDPESNSYYYINFPQKLDAGFYVVETKVHDEKVQMLLQITDIAGFLQEGTDSSLLWLNDIATGSAIDGAQILNISTKKTFVTDANGVAILKEEKEISKENDSGNYYSDNDTYFIITTKSKKQLVIRGSIYSESIKSYWKYLELDRPMYKPNDAVSFWGYVKDKTGGKPIESLTVELTNSYWWGWYRRNEPLISEKLSVKNNTYHGKLNLPNLDPGSYSLVIKNGDEIISSSYIVIQNYTKASYSLSASSNKKGVFEGDSVQFTTKASFFDGTPVPNLEVSYDISEGYRDRKFDNKFKLDSSGTNMVSYTVPKSTETGQDSVNFNAIAKLPETAECSCSAWVNIFRTKQDMNSHIDYIGDKPQISIKMQQIDLNKYNSSTSSRYYDYLGAPVAGSDVKITITHRYYKKTAQKQYYDYINKVTRTYYEYEQAEKDIGTYSVKTGADGTATLPYTLPTSASDHGWYFAEITSQDSTGKTLKDHLYLPIRGYSYGYTEDPNRDYYHLELQAKDNIVDIGESVPMQLKNRDEAASGKRFLYIKGQNGIRSYDVQNKADYKYTFTKDDLPCVYFKGVIFDGVTYHETEYDTVSLRYDYELRRLNLDIKADKTSYKPGEKCTISVTATDKNGKPRSGVVNISVVDEAFFAIYDQKVDVLSDLYSTYVTDGMGYSFSTHERSLDSGSSGGSAGCAPAPNKALDESESARENFVDTAEFKTIPLDQNGKGTYTFKLPDNITTWRATLSAITPDEYAETKTIPIRVSLPFFINFALNNTFLVGDKPSIGLTAYGDGVKPNETVTFQVTSEKNKDFLASGKVSAFKRLDLPLWKLTGGDDTLTITATTASGAKDIIKHKITVFPSYHDAETSSNVPAKIGAAIPHGTKGLTYITFADQGRAALLSEIHFMCHLYGNRIDQTIGRRLANNLLIKYGDEKIVEYAKKRAEQFKDFKISEYQCDDGGLSLFPYSDSDLDLTVSLLPIVKNEVTKVRMLQYLYKNTGDPSKENSLPNAKALFGLALYGEPVLLELERATKIDNISTMDLIYCALGYLALGDRNRATALYNTKIAPQIENLKPYYRIKADDKAESASASAVAAVLASQLNLPEGKGLYQYAIKNHTRDQFLAIEKLLYINNELPKKSDKKGEVSYTIYGKEQKIAFNYGNTKTITLPSQNVPQLKITNVKGDVQILSIYRTPLQNTTKETPDINITRNYYVNGSAKKATTSFKQDDIVRVEIKVTLGPKALKGYYEITDFLPSGLKTLEGNYWWIEDHAKFYISTFDEERTQTFSYLARVQSPGEYTAEGVIVQCANAYSVIKTSNNQKIIIH